MARFFILLFLFVSIIFSQIKTPQPSPFATLSQVVGITEVKIEYSRPGIKGREIFGGLVPFGKIWRTGANAPTKINFSSDVTLEGNPVPAGEYTLYTIPNEKEWTIIIHKKLDAGQNPKQEDDLLRFKVKPKLVPIPVERFTIEVADMTTNSAKINLEWAQTLVSFGLEVDTDKLVMESINAFKEGENSNDAGGWYQAARYYYDSGKDLDEALDMINKSLEINENPFWVLRLKAEILAKKGDYKEAIVFAKKSLVKAQQAGNGFYVKMNEDSIKEWQEK